MKRLLIGAVLAAALGVLQSPVWQHPPAATAQAAMRISMAQKQFLPGVISVAAGTTVVWGNDEDPSGDDVTHDVVADDLTSWASDYLDPGATFAHTFATPGTFRYLCDLHDGMTGTIVVQ